MTGAVDAEVYFWIDNCDTAYVSEDMSGHGDVGMNISDHQESDIVGFEDPDHFKEMMRQVAERPEVSHSSQLMWWMANRSNTDDLDELWGVAREAQHPEDYGDGFEHFNWYMSERPVNTSVVTAAPDHPGEDALERRMNGYSPEVIGGKLKQNGSGIEVDSFCGGDEKAERIREELGVEPSSVPGFAFGNSGGDRPMMEPAEEAFGRGRAYEFATVYSEDSPDFWTHGTLGVISYALETGADVDEASETAVDFLSSGLERQGEIHLDEVERGGREPGEHTYDIIEAYERAVEEVGSW